MDFGSARKSLPDLPGPQFRDRGPHIITLAILQIHLKYTLQPILRSPPPPSLKDHPHPHITIMFSQPPIPGILTVNSDVLDPSKLSRTAFDAWYCDEHIPDVVAKSGIASALRYAHVAGTGDPPSKLSFLTMYSMPDINFTSSAEFTSLEGQRPGPARERIFERAQFATRSYALVQSEEGPAARTGVWPSFHVHGTMNARMWI